METITIVPKDSLTVSQDIEVVIGPKGRQKKFKASGRIPGIEVMQMQVRVNKLLKQNDENRANLEYVETIMEFFEKAFKDDYDDFLTFCRDVKNGVSVEDLDDLYGQLLSAMAGRPTNG